MPTWRQPVEREPMHEFRVAEVNGQHLVVCVAPDPDVGFAAACLATPLWFGYGVTIEQAFASFKGVAKAGLDDMAARGTPFVQAV